MWIVNLEKTAYDEALKFQERCHAERRDNRIDDVIMLLEHDSVITFGQSAESRDLLISEDDLGKLGIPVHHVNRGGKITCHYPGQLVGYFIMDLENFEMDIGAFVRSIEETLILVLADYGVNGERIRHRTGVWVKGEKIAAIGIEVRNRVTLHGFSFNIRENREIYSFFIPCGISDRGVTALERHVTEGTIESVNIRESFMRHWPRASGKTVSAVLSRKEFEAALHGDLSNLRKRNRDDFRKTQVAS